MSWIDRSVESKGGRASKKWNSRRNISAKTFAKAAKLLATRPSPSPTITLLSIAGAKALPL